MFQWSNKQKKKSNYVNHNLKWAKYILMDVKKKINYFSVITQILTIYLISTPIISQFKNVHSTILRKQRGSREQAWYSLKEKSDPPLYCSLCLNWKFSCTPYHDDLWQPQIPAIPGPTSHLNWPSDHPHEPVGGWILQNNKLKKQRIPPTRYDYTNQQVAKPKFNYKS